MSKPATTRGWDRWGSLGLLSASAREQGLAPTSLRVNAPAPGRPKGDRGACAWTLSPSLLNAILPQTCISRRSPARRRGKQSAHSDTILGRTCVLKHLHWDTSLITLTLLDFGTLLVLRDCSDRLSPSRSSVGPTPFCSETSPTSFRIAKHGLTSFRHRGSVVCVMVHGVEEWRTGQQGR